MPLLERRRLLTSPNLQAVVQHIPLDLTSLYMRFLEAIPPGDAGLAGRLLGMIRASVRPLAADEIKIFLLIEQVNDSLSSPDADHTFFSLESIQMILGPLVRMLDSKVRLVHQSLGEYRNDSANDQSNPLPLTVLSFTIAQLRFTTLSLNAMRIDFAIFGQQMTCANHIPSVWDRIIVASFFASFFG